MKNWTFETTRRTLRTFFQVFMGIVAGGIAAVIVEYGTPHFKLALFALITTAVATALAAVMNIERPPDNPVTDEEPLIIGTDDDGNAFELPPTGEGGETNAP